jgi:hypothetical protein
MANPQLPLTSPDGSIATLCMQSTQAITFEASPTAERQVLRAAARPSLLPSSEGLYTTAAACIGSTYLASGQGCDYPGWSAIWR